MEARSENQAFGLVRRSDSTAWLYMAFVFGFGLATINVTLGMSWSRLLLASVLLPLACCSLVAVLDYLFRTPRLNLAAVLLTGTLALGGKFWLLVLGLLRLQAISIASHTQCHALFLEYQHIEPNSPRLSELNLLWFYAFYHHHHSRLVDWFPLLLFQPSTSFLSSFICREKAT